MFLDFETTASGGPAEFIIAKMYEGSYFGQHGIEETAIVHRYASVWALRKCHFIVIP